MSATRESRGHRVVSDVRVECHAGYRGEEMPRRLVLEGRTIEVVEVLACWSEPGTRFFRVRGDDGRVYVLGKDEGAEHWNVPEIAR